MFFFGIQCPTEKILAINEDMVSLNWPFGEAQAWGFPLRPGSKEPLWGPGLGPKLTARETGKDSVQKEYWASQANSITKANSQGWEGKCNWVQGFGKVLETPGWRKLRRWKDRLGEKCWELGERCSEGAQPQLGPRRVREDAESPAIYHHTGLPDMLFPSTLGKLS